MDGDKSVLRTLFNKQLYCGFSCMVWNQEWMGWSSTNARYAGALFRIRNNTPSPQNFRTVWWSSVGDGWSEQSSATMNANQNVQVGGGNCWSCSTTQTWAIPANRISTLVFVSGSTPWSPSCCTSGPRSLFLAIRQGTLALPQGLEYVDDMDYAMGGWDT